MGMSLRRVGTSVLVLVLFSSICGCLGGGGGGDDDKPLETYERTFQTEGTIVLLAQDQPASSAEEVHFDIGTSDITDITITVRVEDNDEGTNPDTVDLVRMWRENGPGEPDEPVEVNGGTTPCEASATFELSGNESMANWWIVELTVTCHGGDDTWPGPFIWRGVPDYGIRYFIEATFNAYNATF